MDARASPLFPSLPPSPVVWSKACLGPALGLLGLDSTQDGNCRGSICVSQVTGGFSSIQGLCMARWDISSVSSLDGPVRPPCRALGGGGPCLDCLPTYPPTLRTYLRVSGRLSGPLALDLQCFCSASLSSPMYMHTLIPTRTHPYPHIHIAHRVHPCSRSVPMQLHCACACAWKAGGKGFT